MGKNESIVWSLISNCVWVYEMSKSYVTYKISFCMVPTRLTIVAKIPEATAIIFSWVRMAPLGGPVVPLVYITMAMSSGLGITASWT